tara:strand:+ start:359 stop:799 length:441 start_codon:yes stop_codon:yes gene_type:complete
MNYIDKCEEINVNVNTIFSLINNVGGYNAFLPWCSESNILINKKNKMIAEIEISKNFLKWKFKTENKYKKNSQIDMELIEGPFSHLKGNWIFKKIDSNNTQVKLYLEYKFDNKVIEVSLKPIFSSIMSSILDSFISEAFKLKNELP